MKRVTEVSLREYIALDWNGQYKPYLKRAVLEMGCIFATAEAKREGVPFTPLYWNKIAEGEWLYSLWEIE
jgi:hypothetical protein